MSRVAASISNIYTLDGRVPLLRSVPFGLQHVLAMFVANIAPIMIVAGVCKLSPQGTASLIQTAMIVAGVGTLVSALGLGPVVHFFNRHVSRRLCGMAG